MASRLLKSTTPLRLGSPRSQLLPRLLQSSRQHATSPRPLTFTSKNFFLSKQPSKSLGPTLRTIFRRKYSNHGYNPYAASYQSGQTAIWGIIGINTIIFGAWQYANATKDRNLMDTLYKNLTLSWNNIQQGRYWTGLTSAFSHKDLIHFAFNMLALHTFSRIVGFLGVGGAQLTALLLGSGIAGSAAYLYQRSYTAGSRGLAMMQTALGASGMVMGAAAAAACLMPFAPMSFLFIPVSMPLWFMVLMYAGVDTYYLHSESSIGHAAHLGGASFGLLFYLASLRRFGGVWHMIGRRR